MALALALGRRGLGNTWPNPSVGAVIVREEPHGPVVVGRGWTQPGGRPHAEVEALRRAGAAARGATIYTTLEPCSHFGQTPPCADAIIAAGIARVVSALDDPNPEIAGEGYRRLRAAGITVVTGVGVEEARRTHAGHVRRMREGRPQVTLKLAVSADGKAGLPGRRPIAITGEAVRERVHRCRAMHDAILVGIGTAVADDPLLTARLPGMLQRSPVRVVLDSTLRLSPESKLARGAREVPLWILTGPDAPSGRADALRACGAEVLPVGGSGDRRDLAAALKLIAARGITRLLVEGGPTVAAAFLTAGLVDTAVLLRSPVVIGEDGINALEGVPLTALTQSAQLRSRGVESVGSDTVEIFERT
ncbi:MAG: bifunctional diaminohydroxyphosphoribosylaminopyrimidine deaminase/5-amino-6-(5-phosphoribosylamino)uracil reductase RibD [Hyphomicrobiales bacterium]|nr:bifunctional diaminohydroxyphosphoribosylaminopyrimidine deaminase/5-amino-6-(5-phosphoribosylamino)uracil reductase RibD [Hyphomicrobiales bacterium]MBV8825163.1 bifunctional diaminohydroxyphosphoribosylaminopyrimidine deaminase/5-amino-6-(5-phosphoribosylamino)uracil reductase RibD [Hyphomicrobiales bacterium]MBV9428061.1 bifunctional diaminohydroxyphosphoribosylaminopyrimidine deaminase/5-amino-6-(5-phosphoribosylamino)uracil reductase RibD [Bradyrhizobiaceae bacterium]